MNFPIENLDLIPRILKQLEALKLNQAMSSDKKWLNSRELSDYIGYSMDSINKMVKENAFIDGLHYHKPQEKLLFDKEQVNNWIVGIKDEKHISKLNYRVSNILKGIE